MVKGYDNVVKSTVEALYGDVKAIKCVGDGFIKANKMCQRRQRDVKGQWGGIEGR